MISPTDFNRRHLNWCWRKVLSVLYQMNWVPVATKIRNKDAGLKCEAGLSFKNWTVTLCFIASWYRQNNVWHGLSSSLQTEIFRQVESNNIFSWSFLILMHYLKVNVQRILAESWLIKTLKPFHLTIRKQTTQSVFFFDWTTAESQEHEDCLGWKHCKIWLLWLRWPATWGITKDITASS